ncbi:NIPSNAP family protein [Pinirhizobacter soli]|uniref:NIPSNAP family protein n=1 Tax=Pinirhizobacter soli TaxID=2786953 RepID=UPI00202A87EF|nr:NIPSNAP family protein [Pinirhizobacter soli]
MVIHVRKVPAEGANNVALFSFASLASYETYRQESQADQACRDAFAYAAKTECVVSYERSFFRPVFG